jgi:hypothetical protein
MIGLVDILEDYEAGDPNTEETLEFFAEHIRTGQAWTLPVAYRRISADLIERGLITREGKLTELGRDAMVEAEPETTYRASDNTHMHLLPRSQRYRQRYKASTSSISRPWPGRPEH